MVLSRFSPKLMKDSYNFIRSLTNIRNAQTTYMSLISFWLWVEQLKIYIKSNLLDTEFQIIFLSWIEEKKLKICINSEMLIAISSYNTSQNHCHITMMYVQNDIFFLSAPELILWWVMFVLNFHILYFIKKELYFKNKIIRVP